MKGRRHSFKDACVAENLNMNSTKGKEEKSSRKKSLRGIRSDSQSANDTFQALTTTPSVP
jgi:hypothetical protein